jgi:hypothetical protein
MNKEVIAMPCIAQLFCITYLVRIINTFKQDVGVEPPGYTNPAFRTLLYRLAYRILETGVK